MNMQLRQLGEKSIDAKALVPPTCPLVLRKLKTIVPAKEDESNGSSIRSKPHGSMGFKMITSKFGGHNAAQDLQFFFISLQIEAAFSVDTHRFSLPRSKLRKTQFKSWTNSGDVGMQSEKGWSSSGREKVTLSSTITGLARLRWAWPQLMYLIKNRVPLNSLISHYFPTVSAIRGGRPHFQAHSFVEIYHILRHTHLGLIFLLHCNNCVSLVLLRGTLTLAENNG